MPCIVRPRPKDEASLVVSVLHDDVGFHRDFHRLNRFLTFGRGYSQEDGGRVFHEIGLFGVGIAPAIRTKTVNNSQDLLALSDVYAFCFGHGDHPLALRSNKSLFRILDGPVGKLAVDIVQLQGNRLHDYGQVFILIAVEVAHHEGRLVGGDDRDNIAEDTMNCGFDFHHGRWRQLWPRPNGRWRGGRRHNNRFLYAGVIGLIFLAAAHQDKDNECKVCANQKC